MMTSSSGSSSWLVPGWWIAPKPNGTLNRESNSDSSIRIGPVRVVFAGVVKSACNVNSSM